MLVVLILLSLRRRNSIKVMVLTKLVIIRIALGVDKLAEAVSVAGFETDLKLGERKSAIVEGSAVKIYVKVIDCGGCVKSVENSLKRLKV